MTNMNFRHEPRGYRVTYHFGTVNYCPGCGHSQWHIGRSSAECAFCTTVLPLKRTASSAPEFAIAC